VNAEILERLPEGRQIHNEREAALPSTPELITADMTAGAQRFADEINEQHRLSLESFTEHAIRCGELLLEQKQRVGYGSFGKWIESNCEFSVSTANNYMKLAKTPNAQGKSGAIRRLYPSGFADAAKKPSAEKPPEVKPPLDEGRSGRRGSGREWRTDDGRAGDRGPARRRALPLRLSRPGRIEEGAAAAGAGSSNAAAARGDLPAQHGGHDRLQGRGAAGLDAMTIENLKRLRNLFVDLGWTELHAVHLRSEVRNILAGSPRPPVLTLRERFEERRE